jgi:hypothetical protein
MPGDDWACIRFDFTLVATCHGLVHGLVGWFDVTFEGTEERVLLSTAPGAPTHWNQMRLLFSKPIEMSVGQLLRGRLVMQANPQSSYSLMLDAELVSKGWLAPHTYELHRHIYWAHNGVQ